MPMATGAIHGVELVGGLARITYPDINFPYVYKVKGFDAQTGLHDLLPQGSGRLVKVLLAPPLHYTVHPSKYAPAHASFDPEKARAGAPVRLFQTLTGTCEAGLITGVHKESGTQSVYMASDNLLVHQLQTMPVQYLDPARCRVTNPTILLDSDRQQCGQAEAAPAAEAAGQQPSSTSKPATSDDVEVTVGSMGGSSQRHHQQQQKTAEEAGEEKAQEEGGEGLAAAAAQQGGAATTISTAPRGRGVKRRAANTAAGKAQRRRVGGGGGRGAGQRRGIGNGKRKVRGGITHVAEGCTGCSRVLPVGVLGIAGTAAAEINLHVGLRLPQ
jgi:hypothetical protein